MQNHTFTFVAGFLFSIQSCVALGAGVCGQSIARLSSPLLPTISSAISGESLSLNKESLRSVALESLPPAAARELQRFLAAENNPAKRTQPQQAWTLRRTGAEWLIAFKSERTSREYLVQYGLLALNANGGVLAQSMTRWLRPTESINHLAELVGGKPVVSTQLPQGLLAKEVKNPAEFLPPELLNIYVSNPAQQAKSTVYRIENGEGLVGYQIFFELSSARLRAQERTVSIFLDRALRPVAQNEVYF